ncbi:hypothetical protein N0M98_11640 [Paenibacillus doosanensis]|uniref:Uncharacterized protein n=1 Tax=Paenibacillus konkukensis TaxID=2020716 RepID=A0ABY4RU22_9BACL|nr:MULTISPECIES: hypothetical protein [Paenibacillus]MCS7460797.1 hypothetical protein [Paenibacillus doosanensis]UQZ85977.1 hypothetical protein SK3146_05269 [Paenibacillus konkukensis]
MTQSHDQVCPWCQTEIVWDPEIGPEETCPHCFNELGDYRSINLTVEDEDLDEEAEEDDEGEDEGFEGFEEEYEDFDGMNEYEEGVQRVLDHQEVTPECPTCHSYMLLAGSRKAASDYAPNAAPGLGQPLLQAGYGTQVFVCPSCFKVEHVLSEADRMAMIELLKRHGMDE